MRRIWTEMLVWVRRNMRLTVYLAVSAVIVVCATGAFMWQNSQFRAYQREVIEIQEKEYAHLVQIIKTQDGKFSYRVGEFSVAEQVEKINNDTSRLLEMEMGKLQSEYEVLELWTALITVVFLLFSFFSMFRSEELERQGRETVKHINDMHTKVQSEVTDIMRATSADLRQLRTDARVAIDEMKLSLTSFRDTKAEELTNFIKTERGNMETFSQKLQKKSADDISKLTDDLRQTMKLQQEDAEVQLGRFGRKIEELEARGSDLIRQMETMITMAGHIENDVPEEDVAPENDATNADVMAEDELNTDRMNVEGGEAL